MINENENLKGLLLEQGRDLYDVSRQEQKELPKILIQISDLELKRIVGRQLDAAKNQNDRLKEIFKELNENPKGKKNKHYEAIFNDSKDLLKRSKDLSSRDAAIIISVQRLNHNNIVGLGVFTSYASEMGYNTIVNTLRKSLEEEKEIENELNFLATEKANREFEISEV